MYELNLTRTHVERDARVAIFYTVGRGLNCQTSSDRAQAWSLIINEHCQSERN